MTEAGEPGPRPEAGAFAAVDVEERMLGRSSEGRMITGVCAGLGRYTRMDPVLFRVGFAVLVIGSGIGIMLYIAAFLLMRAPDGGPGYIEQWSRRVFDPETVMGLLAAILTLGLVINLAADGIGTATVVVGTLLAICLLAAHSRGVDLLALARSLPERLRTAARRPPPAPYPHPQQAFTPADGMPAAGMPTTGVPTTGMPVADYPQDAPPAQAPGTEPGYRSLADLAREARLAAQAAAPPPVWSGRQRSFDSSGEPFAPHGPYAQRPYPDPYSGHVPAQKAVKRPRSYVGGITTFIAFLVGGIMVASQAPPSPSHLPLIGGIALIIVGAGLLVTTWFDRGAGLVATGTILSVVLIAGANVSDIPKKIGSYTWEPVDSSQPVSAYSVGIGDGTLDLSDIKLAPGSRTRFDASVAIGEIKVIVPRTARVEVFGNTRLGDVKIEHKVEGGADIQHNQVLEPDVPVRGAVPVIELHVKAGIGDVEVRRAA
jgi:phage shock protein PspC (stress-responsive transcriptional regulator)